jgi:multiple sugar transport system ATP-binding protein
MASVSIENVSKTFGAIEVIHSLSLAIADGSFVVLLGPSGCGKSTLLRMIADLETITEGKVRIGAMVVNELHPKDRDIAMVFQNYALYAHMNVFENMAFSMRLKRMPQAEVAAKVNWAASILNLTPFLDRLPSQLSGGQRQRVAMGRAMVRNPQVFLFDEPLSNLDAKLRVQMRTEIKELHQRLKTTTVYVTHDQIEAMTMADVIVILRDGYIEQVGKPMEVYNRPANLFVAEFIGAPSMNILRGTVETSGGAPAVRTASGVALPLPEGARVASGQAIAYGVRPEHFHPSPNGGIEARINVVEPTGPEVHIYADLGGQEICAISRDRTEFTPGEAITLAPERGRIHLFDAETGRSLNS